MLTGEFNEVTGWGMVLAQIYLPRFGAAVNVQLVVDTGADSVSLSPRDCEEAGVDLSALEFRGTGFGAGGAFQEFREPAMLSFRGSEGTHHYLSTVSIPASDPAFPHAPSLLGREILNRWAMTYDPMNRRLQFEVHSSDRFEPA